MLDKKPKIKLIGRREHVNFPLLNLFHIEAKIDTGAYTSAIHCKKIVQKTVDNKSLLCFQSLDDVEHCFETYSQKKIKNSFGEIEERYIIKTLISIGGKKINTTISLSDRESMRYPVLIGRRLLKGRFVVDVNQIYTNGITFK
jgi:hypothetical protein